MTKRQRSTRRRQRAKAKVMCAIDFETRMWPFGDCHIGMGLHALNEQVMAYAVLGRATEFVVLTGGDLVHHPVTDKMRDGVRSYYDRPAK